jgi:hypothetical protein
VSYYTPTREEDRKIDLHARFARMKINFPNFLAFSPLGRAMGKTRFNETWLTRTC